MVPPVGGVRCPNDTDVSNNAITVTKIYASGICCPSEVPLIINILRPLPGVSEVSSVPLMANMQQSEQGVMSDFRASVLQQLVRAAAYKPIQHIQHTCTSQLHTYWEIGQDTIKCREWLLIYRQHMRSDCFAGGFCLR